MTQASFEVFSLGARELKMKAQAVGLIAVLWTLTSGCGVFSAPGYNGPPSEHFDGEQFQNQETHESGSFWGFLKWRFSREQGPWRDWVDEAPGPAPPERVTDGGLRITFINHATLLIQMDGMNILTDPIWSERCSPVGWAGPKRHRNPGIRFEDLPPIHVVLISHNHYDHLDAATLQRLSQEHKPRILAGLGNLAYLQEIGVERGADMDWWDEVPVSGDVNVTF
ncbi:MAG: MBL fold metallo-hydrolase, partial [Myxococcota bacterium]|nr:MBL fold metallo-hydrolase [Myxococcota bacterium]